MRQSQTPLVIKKSGPSQKSGVIKRSCRTKSVTSIKALNKNELG